MSSAVIRRSLLLVAAAAFPLGAQKSLRAPDASSARPPPDSSRCQSASRRATQSAQASIPAVDSRTAALRSDSLSALLAPAAGVNLVGNGGPSRGNFAATVGGAAAGYGALYFALPLATKVNPKPLKIAAIIAAFALPAIGATIAYNATRK